MGLVLAGPAVAHFGYHWLFALPLALTALALLGVHAFLPSNSPSARHRLPWASALALSAVLCTMLLVISEGPAWGWASGRTLLLAAATAALMAGWVILERRAPHPLVDARLMRLAVVWRTNLAALFLGAGMFAVNLLVPAFLETPQRAGYGLGRHVTQAGLFWDRCRDEHQHPHDRRLPRRQLAAVILAAGVRPGRLPAQHGYVLAFGFGAAVLASCAAIAALTPVTRRVVAAEDGAGPALFLDRAEKFHGEPADAALADGKGRL